jgi:hypothetical protein
MVIITYSYSYSYSSGLGIFLKANILDKSGKSLANPKPYC